MKIFIRSIALLFIYLGIYTFFFFLIEQFNISQQINEKKIVRLHTACYKCMYIIKIIKTQFIDNIINAL